MDTTSRQSYESFPSAGSEVYLRRPVMHNAALLMRKKIIDAYPGIVDELNRQTRLKQQQQEVAQRASELQPIAEVVELPVANEQSDEADDLASLAANARQKLSEAA